MRDSRTLHLLQCQQLFLDSGGYGRPFRSRWRPTLIFRDSPICLNFEAGAPLQSCERCPLFQFVPESKRTLAAPCHQIPLNSAGDTIASMYQNGKQERLDEAVRNWLRATINTLEEEKDHAGS